MFMLLWYLLFNDMPAGFLGESVGYIVLFLGAFYLDVKITLALAERAYQRVIRWLVHRRME